MQVGFYFDQTRCTGCWTCIVACKDWNNVPAGSASWRTVKTIQQGRFPDVFLSFLSTACHHCADPACVPACSQGAITKRAEDGVVTLEPDSCIGQEACGECLDSCPYGALQFGDEDNPEVQKCDFCLDRWSQNEPPICVASCPMRALDAGPMEEMKARYGDNREAQGFEYDEKLRPSVLFKPKLRQDGPSGSDS
jgi:anaerobic dimethyl sulfoxide reductase subunit B (iron-sulfur subunit)